MVKKAKDFEQNVFNKANSEDDYTNIIAKNIWHIQEKIKAHKQAQLTTATTTGASVSVPTQTMQSTTPTLQMAGTTGVTTNPHMHLVKVPPTITRSSVVVTTYSSLNRFFPLFYVWIMKCLFEIKSKK